MRCSDLEHSEHSLPTESSRFNHSTSPSRDGKVFLYQLMEASPSTENKCSLSQYKTPSYFLVWSSKIDSLVMLLLLFLVNIVDSIGIRELMTNVTVNESWDYHGESFALQYVAHLLVVKSSQPHIYVNNILGQAWMLPHFVYPFLWKGNLCPEGRLL